MRETEAEAVEFVVSQAIGVNHHPAGIRSRTGACLTAAARHLKLEFTRRPIDDSSRPATLPGRLRRAASGKKATSRAIPDITASQAISAPCGFTSAGLPVGLMIATFFRIALREWHSRRPPLRPDMPVAGLSQ